jgi:hypothetical protein
MKNEVQGSFITLKRKNGDSVKVDKIKKYNWKISDRPGEFHWIDKDDLSVDFIYQRDKLNNNRISEFASNWCWAKCGALSVAIRNNEWYVIDGQHRKLAADKRSDIQKLPCLIFELDGVSEEARAFVNINSSKTAIQSFDRFKAMIVGKDETAIGLNKLFESTGHRASKGSDIKDVCCLMLAWRLYGKYKDLFTDVWLLAAEINQECQIRDHVLRSLYYTEVAARKIKLSIVNGPVRSFLIKMGGLSLGAMIKKEVNIVGLGGARVESNALIKAINKQKIKAFKIPLQE